MDEDEELYRLMDEDDDFYMGDRDDEGDEPDNTPNYKYPVCSNSNNAGCMLLLPLIVALMSLVVVLVI